MPQLPDDQELEDFDSDEENKLAQCLKEAQNVKGNRTLEDDPTPKPSLYADHGYGSDDDDRKGREGVATNDSDDDDDVRAAVGQDLRSRGLPAHIIFREVETPDFLFPQRPRFTRSQDQKSTS
ncbi:hypothetical protein BGZ83_001287 [Gryganskiella cystojenkinii]|nr:hypothetical protein BGZ83_001287 [Gryganskiella cystojenkinii]